MHIHLLRAMLNWPLLLAVNVRDCAAMTGQFTERFVQEPEQISEIREIWRQDAPVIDI